MVSLAATSSHMEKPPPKAQPAPSKDTREERLAQALRQNLRRRKATGKPASDPKRPE
jgi:hypothetical protein